MRVTNLHGLHFWSSFKMIYQILKGEGESRILQSPHGDEWQDKKVEGQSSYFNQSEGHKSITKARVERHLLRRLGANIFYGIPVQQAWKNQKCC